MFPIPGVSLKHSASSGHSDLKRLLLPAVLEAGEDGSQGSSAELGSSSAHGHTHVLHQLSIRGPWAQAQVLQDSVHTCSPGRGAGGTGCCFEAQVSQMFPAPLPSKSHGYLGDRASSLPQSENPIV